MYLGILLAGNAAGALVGATSLLALDAPWWLAVILWSLTGTVAMLTWILWGVTHPEAYADARALSECEDEPGASAVRDGKRIA